MNSKCASWVKIPDNKSLIFRAGLGISLPFSPPPRLMRLPGVCALFADAPFFPFFVGVLFSVSLSWFSAAAPSGWSSFSPLWIW